MVVLLNTLNFKHISLIHNKRQMVIVVETSHVFTICTSAHWTLPVFYSVFLRS